MANDFQASLQPRPTFGASVAPQQFPATLAASGPAGPPGPQGPPLGVQDEGVALTQRSYLNFVGIGVTATDDAANNRTKITIGGGGSQTPWMSDINGGNFNLANVGKLAIGRATVSGFQLDVTGAANVTGVITSTGDTVSNDGTGAAYVTFAQALATRWIIGKTGAVETGSNVGSDFTIIRYSDAGSQLGTPFSISRATGVVNFAQTPTIGGASIISAAQTPWLSDIDAATKTLFNAGKIGIGVTGPTSQLHLGGYDSITMATGNSSGYLVHRYLSTSQSDCLSLACNYLRSDSASGTVPYNLGTAEIQLVASGASAPFSGIYFRTGGIGAAPAVRMTIDNTGNVAIGATPIGPLAPLHVTGSIAVYTSSSATAGAPVGASLYIGDLGFASSASYYNSAPGMSAVYAAPVNAAGNLAFYVYNGAAGARSEVMRLTAPATSVFRVGILNTAPGYTLDVAGDCNLSAGSVYRINGVPISTGGGGSQTPWTSDIDGGGHTLSNVLNLYTNNSIQVGLNTNTSARMVPTGFYFSSPGNSPRWFLLTSGTETGSNAGTDFYLARFSDAGVQLSNPFWVVRSTGMVNCGNGLTVTGGNIGVGTGALPSYAFTCVADTTYTGGYVVVANNMNAGNGYSFYGIDNAPTGQAAFILQNDLSHQFLFIYGGSNHANSYFRDTAVMMFPGDCVFYSNTVAEMIRIKGSSGNVGIGQANPQSKLSVSGSIGLYSVTGATAGSPVAASLYLGDANFAGSSTYYNSAPGLSAVFNPSQGITADLAFYVYSGMQNARSEVMRVVYTPGTIGRVGIMKTAPAYALDVAGDCNITGTYRVNGTPFSTGGAAQTPWLQDIDGGGWSLTNANIGKFGGYLQAGPDTGNALLLLPSNRAIEFYAAGPLARWYMTGAWGNETGGNAGGNFGLFSYDDAGVFLRTVYIINRNTGIVDFTQVPTIGGVPISAGGGSQTPWTSDIDGGGFALKNAGNAGVGNNLASLPDGNASCHLVVGSIVNTTIGEITMGSNMPSFPNGAIGLLNFANFNSANTDKRIATIYGFTDTSAISGALAFFTASAGSLAERMRITSAGLVGIGRTPTTYPLEVQGDCNITGTYRVNGTKLTIRLGRTFGLVGDVTALTTLPSIFVVLTGAQASTLYGLRAKINSGTSVGVQVKRNGTNVGSVITVTTTVATTTLGAVALADGDELTLTLSSPVATPSNLSATLILDQTL